MQSQLRGNQSQTMHRNNQTQGCSICHARSPVAQRQYVLNSNVAANYTPHRRMADCFLLWSKWYRSMAAINSEWASCGADTSTLLLLALFALKRSLFLDIMH
jgi:hypothetical protein